MDLSSLRDIDLIDDLRAQPVETPWLEFKSNLTDEAKIGKLISALSNAARLEGKEQAFLVWGIEDGTHNVIGTSFDPFSKQIGNQVFELWLRQRLSPAPAIQFRAVEHPEGHIILLEIPAPTMAPTSFESVPYIRIGSATPKLSDDPGRYQALIDEKGHFFCCFSTIKAIFTIIFHILRRAASDDRTLKRPVKWSVGIRSLVIQIFKKNQSYK